MASPRGFAMRKFLGGNISPYSGFSQGLNQGELLQRREDFTNQYIANGDQSPFGVIEANRAAAQISDPELPRARVGVSGMLQRAGARARAMGRII